jgi:2-polyprenyl-3-methyl-5-hydroxy-6-metoxy-1,4-benzoquinol methylase
MNQLVHYNNCPVCGSAAISTVLSVRDYTVSNEVFPIAECSDCTFRFTQDVPDEAGTARYYKSENYISHTNTSKGLVNNLYQRVRKKTLKQKRKLIEDTVGISKGNLLDVGAGTGAFANEMQQAGWQVTGLEPDADARIVAKKDFGVELSPINIFYNLPDSSFDAITMWHVLEHVHDLNGYVAKLKLVLKKNGCLFIAVPNYTSKDAAIYKEYWAAYDVPRHLYHFSPKAMQLLMEKHGLEIAAYKAMWYDSFYVSMLSSKYKNGKTNLAASFFNGVRSNLKAMGEVKKCSSVIYIIRLAG